MGTRAAKNKGTPNMSAGQYEYIAHILRDAKDGVLKDVVGDDAEQLMIALSGHFANHLRFTNPKFDKHLFMEAVRDG